MSAIVDIFAREILDSRGNPTVECDVLQSLIFSPAKFWTHAATPQSSVMYCSNPA